MPLLLTERMPDGREECDLWLTEADLPEPLNKTATLDMMKIRKIRAEWLLIFALWVHGLHAQKIVRLPQSVELGGRYEINSLSLKEKRQLLIYTPPKSLKPQKYPLIVVFDGETLFESLVSTVKYMNYNGEIPQMPEAIVVGVVNTQRMRDMPIPHGYGQKQGEEAFSRFVAFELVPELKKQFSTTDLTILVGHSQGALFATYLSLTHPLLFPWVIALDGPFDIHKNTAELEKSYLELMKEDRGMMRYFSGEALYGWGDRLTMPDPAKKQVKWKDETHESMPLKGLYEGLKTLFYDFVPPAKDLHLSALTKFYDAKRRAYKSEVSVPYKVLVAAAERKMGEKRKQEISELIDYGISRYGPTQKLQTLRTKVQEMTETKDDELTRYLSLPGPSDTQIQPFIGKWQGVINVPDGRPEPTLWEIEKRDGNYVLKCEVIPINYKTESVFVAVSEQGELLWGRRNNGGGVFVSKGAVNQNGELTGVMNLIGFTPPAGITLSQNTFTFKKIK
ncbi:MAG: alpha/beta hydrolase-fold protein [Spirosomataceae bacterium]